MQSGEESCGGFEWKPRRAVHGAGGQRGELWHSNTTLLTGWQRLAARAEQHVHIRVVTQDALAYGLTNALIAPRHDDPAQRG